MTYNSMKDYERANCRLTIAAVVVYLLPVLWMFTMDTWKDTTFLSGLVGIWLSKGILRRVLAVAFLVMVLIFNKWVWMLIVWYVTFQFVYFMDGRDKLSKPGKEGWE